MEYIPYILSITEDSSFNPLKRGESLPLPCLCHLLTSVSSFHFPLWPHPLIKQAVLEFLSLLSLPPARGRGTDHGNCDPTLPQDMGNLFCLCPHPSPCPINKKGTRK